MKRLFSTLKTPLLISLLVVSVGMVWPTVASGRELVGYWPLDGSAKDASGNNHHGQVKGGRNFVEGKVGKAFHSPEGFSFIRVAMTDKLRFWDKVTVMCWAYLDFIAEDQYHGLVHKNGPPGPDVGVLYTWRLYVRRNAKGVRRGNLLPWASKITFGVRSLPKPGRGDANTEFRAEAERWYHVAGTYDGQTVRLYVDGQFAGEGVPFCAPAPCDGPLLENADTPITIGGEPTRLFGKVDEVAIFHEVLTEGEIKRAMTKGILDLLAVDPAGKLATTFGQIKRDYGIAD